MGVRSWGWQELSVHSLEHHRGRERRAWEREEEGKRVGKAGEGRGRRGRKRGKGGGKGERKEPR